MSDDPKQVVETIDIDAPGESVSVRMHGATLLDIVIEEDATAEYAVDIRKRQGDWFQNIGAAFTGGGPHNEVRRTGAHELRVRCTAGTAGTGDTATIALLAGGG